MLFMLLTAVDEDEDEKQGEEGEGSALLIGQLHNSSLQLSHGIPMPESRESRGLLPLLQGLSTSTV